MAMRPIHTFTNVQGEERRVGEALRNRVGCWLSDCGLLPRSEKNGVGGVAGGRNKSPDSLTTKYSMSIFINFHADGSK